MDSWFSPTSAGKALGQHQPAVPGREGRGAAGQRAGGIFYVTRPVSGTDRYELRQLGTDALIATELPGRVVAIGASGDVYVAAGASGTGGAESALLSD